MFSKIFQREAGAVDLGHFKSQLEELYGFIDMQLLCPEGEEGSKFKRYPERIKELNAMRNITIKSTTGRNSQFIQGLRTQYLKSLKRHLEGRFPDPGLLSAIHKVFDVPNYPNDYEDVDSYLGDAYDTVILHYAKVRTVGGMRVNLCEKDLLDKNRIPEVSKEAGEQFTGCLTRYLWTKRNDTKRIESKARARTSTHAHSFLFCMVQQLYHWFSFFFFFLFCIYIIA
jgi:hypothetical protein